MAKAQQKVAQQLRPKHEASEVIRVLLLEDTPNYSKVKRILRDNMHSNQFQVTHAKRLLDALECLGKRDFDIVLLDPVLSDIHGIETFDKVYAQAPSIPIIILMDNDNVTCTLEALHKGAQDYLAKEQLDDKLLIHALQLAMDRRQIKDGLKNHCLQVMKEDHIDVLQKSEERYRTLFEQSKNAIIVTSRERSIIAVNQATLALFNYTREEMLNMHLYELYAAPATTKESQQFMEQEEVTLRKKDGTVINGLLTATVHRADDGSMQGYQVVISDIKERRSVDEKLSGQALIFENINDAIIVTDLEGNIKSWNPAAKEMFGCEGDFLRTTIGGLTTQVTKGKLQTGRWTGEMNFTRQDGTEGICETTVIPLRNEVGTITSVFGVCRDITDRKRAEAYLQQSYEQLQETLIATVNTLASTIEMRDPYTAGHQRRVTMLACAIAEEMELTNDQFDGLRLASLIHDLGKINVPAEILSKPGKISEIEFSIIRYHPQICHDILKKIELPWPVAQIVLHHHERLDGSGYPQGLKGDEIIYEAKILGVADVVEAMASHRPYRPALGVKLALEEITKNRGILYDPVIVDTCVKLFTKRKFRFD
jgi:PAS domain S-box-containing protein